MASYYNENDPYAAEWLVNLIMAGYLPDGEVDTRSIVDVNPSDLVGFTQCHFFAGIGGWPLALARSGWPDDRPVWTGSCPCQPFSNAGRGAKFSDDRHLWPTWMDLIREQNPTEVFGEQVASKDGIEWLDHVCTDLEGSNYSVGASVLTAAGSGSPHIRERIWFYAYACSVGSTRPVTTDGIGALRPWRAFGPMDLQSLLDRPYSADERFPKPLIVSTDDGFSSRVGRLRAYGNAINVDTAIDFIQTCMEYESL